MPIHFRCPHCDKLLATGAHKGGAQIDCPMCDRPVTVPPRTEVELPTTTVVPTDLSRAWWVDAPDAPAEADAWWLTAASPPPAAETTMPPPEAIVSSPTPEPASESLRLEPSPKPAPVPHKTVFVAHSFRRTHVLILAGGVAAALLVIGGALALLSGRAPKETPRAPEQTAQAGGAEKKFEPPPETDPDAEPPPEEKPDKTSEPDKPPVIENKKDEPVPPAKTEVLKTPAAPVKPASPVEVVKKSVPPGKLVVKYRRDLTEDQLRRQLDNMTELSLDRGKERTQAQRAVKLARAAKQNQGRIETASLLVKNREDLAGLPLIMGDDCHLTLAAAEHLQGGSVALRAHLTEASQAARPGEAADRHPDPKKLNAILMADGERYNKWLKPEAIPALQQLLMAENEAIREVLVDQIARIDGKRASVALAQRALFDLHPGVRKSALSALAQRPREDYQQVLLDGFRHPWPAIADHAAEALVALSMRDAVPALLGLLDRPNPAAPYKKPGQEGMYIREMVCLNHLRNCLLCHPASMDDQDKVRGAVPQLDQPLSGGGGYGAQRQSIFVRADVTYLWQDFSLQRPVEKHGAWPAVQRFDFLVRERLATPADMKAARAAESNGPSEHQKALFFVLRELTGTDPGPSAEDWKRLFLHGAKVRQVRGGLASAAGVAADGRGRVWVSAAGEILRAEPDEELAPWRKDLDGCKGLAVDLTGRLIVCQAAKGRLLALDRPKQDALTLADRHKGQPLHAPTHAVVDRQGGIYFTDAAVLTPGNSVGVAGAVYYLSARGTLTRLPIPLSAPAGIALSPNEKTLYLTAAGTADVMAYPLEGVGIPGKGRVLCKLERHGDAPVLAAGGLAVDGRGNLYVANRAMRAVQVHNSEGARLGLISLPDSPLACAVGGPEGKTLFVTTRHALFKVQLDTAGPGLAAGDH